MSPPRRFRTLCRHRSHDRLVALVAALHRARGRAVDREGDRLRVRTARGVRVHLVRPPAAHDGVPPDVDRVLVTGTVDTSPPTVRDLGDLYRQLRYAVDRETARSLAATHLDDAGAVAAADGHPSDGTPVRPLAGRPAVGAVGAVVAVVVLGLAGTAAVVLPGLTLGAGATAPTDTTAPAPTPTPAPVPDTPPTTVAATDTAASALDGVELGSNGNLDGYALAARHAELLANRSYTLVISYHRVKNEQWGRLRQVVRVAGDGRYRVRTTRNGSLGSVPVRVTTGDRYSANGTLHVRTDAEITRRSVYRDRPFNADIERYAGWYLSVRDVTVRRVVDDTLRLSLSGEPYPRITNATGRARVTREGLVTTLRRVHDRNGATVTVRMRVSRVGNTTIERPAWA